MQNTVVTVDPNIMETAGLDLCLKHYSNFTNVPARTDMNVTENFLRELKIRVMAKRPSNLEEMPEY